MISLTESQLSVIQEKSLSLNNPPDKIFNMENIGFENYRSYSKETLIEIKPLTLLTGPNNSGKSSVIKAAKLLKQNAGGTLPFNLNFLPDDFGHFLGSFESIKNYKSNNDVVSFLYKINLPAYGNECYIKLEFEYLKNKSSAPILKSYSLQTLINGKLIEVFKLFPSADYENSKYFAEISVNFRLVRDLFIRMFIPILKNEKNEFDDFFNDEGVHIENLPRFDYNPPKRLYGLSKYPHLDVNVQAEMWLNYEPQKPLLPFYQILTGDFPYEREHDESVLKFINDLKQTYTDHGIIFIPENENIEFYNYFKDLENNLFDFLLKRDIRFPFELFIEKEDNRFNTWGGIVFDNTIEGEDFITSEHTRAALKEFDPAFSLLMEVYNRYFDLKLLGSDQYNNSNSGILNEFIFQSIHDSIESIKRVINSPYFFDSNRIEQTLFYHSTHSAIGYNLLKEILCDKSELLFDKIRQNLRLMEIADNFEIVPEKYGIYSVYLITGKGRHNLSEFGYGTTKIFFLILALLNYGTIYIEEPESNLHPNFQSRLADLIANEQENKQFIIETHSEYLIRRLQYLVAVGKVNHKNIVINYFNPANERKKSGVLTKIEIRRDGFLTSEFGPGFFDESTNLMRDLFKLTSYN